MGTDGFLALIEGEGGRLVAHNADAAPLGLFSAQRDLDAFAAGLVKGGVKGDSPNYKSLLASHSKGAKKRQQYRESKRRKRSRAKGEVGGMSQKEREI